jgi:hypothetical protein
MKSHVAVVFDGMQISPGQDIFITDDVPIIWLMHVPIKIEV